MSGKSRAAIRARERARARDAAALRKAQPVAKGTTKKQQANMDAVTEAADKAKAKVNKRAAEVPEKSSGLGKVTTADL